MAHLSAEAAYLAARNDFYSAEKTAKDEVNAGTLDPYKFRDRIHQLLDEAWRKRIERGELPSRAEDLHAKPGCDATGCTKLSVGWLREVSEVPRWRHPAGSQGYAVLDPGKTVFYCAEHEADAKAYALHRRRDDIVGFLKELPAQEILGLMIMQTCPIAHCMRAAGTEIPTKTELEQAHVLTWLLGIAADKGLYWRSVAADELRRMADEVAASKRQWS